MTLQLRNNNPPAPGLSAADCSLSPIPVQWGECSVEWNWGWSNWRKRTWEFDDLSRCSNLPPQWASMYSRVTSPASTPNFKNLGNGELFWRFSPGEMLLHRSMKGIFTKAIRAESRIWRLHNLRVRQVYRVLALHAADERREVSRLDVAQTSGFSHRIHSFWEVNTGSAKDFRFGIEKHHLWIWHGNYVVKTSGIQLIETKVAASTLHPFLYFLNVAPNLNHLDPVFTLGWIGLLHWVCIAPFVLHLLLWVDKCHKPSRCPSHCPWLYSCSFDALSIRSHSFLVILEYGSSWFKPDQCKGVHQWSGNRKCNKIVYSKCLFVKRTYFSDIGKYPSSGTSEASNILLLVSFVDFQFCSSLILNLLNTTVDMI